MRSLGRSSLRADINQTLGESLHCQPPGMGPSTRHVLGEFDEQLTAEKWSAAGDAALPDLSGRSAKSPWDWRRSVKRVADVTVTMVIWSSLCR